MTDLKFGLQLELKGDQVVVRGLDGVRGEIRGMSSDVQRTTKDVEQGAVANKKFAGTLSTVGKAATAVGGLIAAMGVTVLTQNLYRVNAESQKLNSSLITVTGSQRAAAAAWAELEKFASTTPFALEQSVNAFVKMKALGLDPTTSALTSFGNTASAMGKDLNQMIEAVADASTGEFERLKEFGIKANVEGDKVRLTFQGVTTEIKNDSEAITQYLENIGNTAFAGAMERQMDTLGGAMSNLQNNVDALMRAIGQRGVNEGLAGAISWVSELFAELTAQISGPTIASVTAEIARLQAMLDSGNLGGGRNRQDPGSIKERIKDLSLGLVDLKAVSGDVGAINARLGELNLELLKLEGEAQTGKRRGGGAGKSRITEIRAEIAALEAVKAESFTDLNKQVDDLISSSALFGFELDKNTASTKEAEKAAKKLAEEKAKLHEAYLGNISNLQFETEWLQKELVATVAGEDALRAFNREKTIEVELRRMNAEELAPEEVKLLREEIEARYDAEQALKDQTDALEDAQKAQEDANETMEQFITEIVGSFVDGADSIGDAFKDLWDRLKREFINSGVSQILGFNSSTSTPLLSGIGQIFGLGGGSAAGGSGGFSLSNFSSLASIGKTLMGGTAAIGSTLFDGGIGLAKLLGPNAFGQGVLNTVGGIQGLGTSLGFSGGNAFLAGGLTTLGAGYVGGKAGTALGGSLFGKQAESSIGASIGGAIGTYILPGIGTFIGSALGGLADAAFGGDGKKRSAIGVVAAPSNVFGGHAGAKEITADSGLRLKTYVKRGGDGANEAADALLQEFGLADTGLLGLYDLLYGKDVNLKGQKLSGSNFQAGKNIDQNFFGVAGFNGVSGNLADAPDAFVRAWVKKANQLTSTALNIEPLLKLQKEGESLGGALIRLQRQFIGVNAVLDRINLQQFSTTVYGIKKSDSLLSAFGGADNFEALATAYGERFFTAQEKLDSAEAMLTDSFQALGYSLPKTREQFRSLVEGLNLNTEKGQQTFAALLSLAPAFDELITGIEGTTGAVNELSKALDPNNFATKVDFLRAHFLSGGTQDNIPAFASGGSHVGGLRLVGENGPELEVTGPSQIINASSTRSMFDNSGLESELRALRQEVARLRNENKQAQYQIAKNTQRFAKLADRWEVDGLPETRTA